MAEILGPCHCSHGPSFQSPRRPKKCPICPLSREQTPTAPKAHCSENTHSHWSCYFNSDYRHHLWCWICRGCNKSCLCPYAKQHTRTLTQESMGKILQGVSIFRTMVLRSSQLFFSFSGQHAVGQMGFQSSGTFSGLLGFKNNWLSEPWAVPEILKWRLQSKVLQEGRKTVCSLWKMLRLKLKVIIWTSSCLRVSVSHQVQKFEYQ